MDFFVIATIVITLAAIFGYINVRFLKLPNTIGLMLITILFTLAVFLVSNFDPRLLEAERYVISQIDFQTLLLDVMLSFLLFAGALHTDFAKLKNLLTPIIAFATVGVIISTILIGVFMYYIFQWMSYPVDFIFCLLFGSLISPTDPIAVLGILKKAGAPEKVETVIVGESLFNDGVGVIIFMTIYQVAQSGVDSVVWSHVATDFVKEVLGAGLLGFVLGWLAYQLMKRIDDYEIEVIITLALVFLGTTIAHTLHVSAPLTMVTAGLLVGTDTVRRNAMGGEVESYVDMFWELIDMILNMVLFVLIGMEMLTLRFDMHHLWAGLIAIPVVLLCRYISLSGIVRLFNKKYNLEPHTLEMMTWGGLRGAISIALVLGLTSTMEKDLFTSVTYIVVVFSILVQGLSLNRVIQMFYPNRKIVANTSGH